MERAEQYWWPSAAAHLGLEADGLTLLGIDLWRAFGGAEAWRELLMSREEPAGLRLVRRCTYAGQRYGRETFLEAKEERFGRRWPFETETGGAANRAVDAS